MAPSTSPVVPRVVSLLPAATEMVCLVGGGAKLVGRGHEDDFPPDIMDRPVVTAARHAFSTSSGVVTRSLCNRAERISVLYFPFTRVSRGVSMVLDPVSCEARSECQGLIIFADMDKKVSQSVAQGEGLYFVDAALLKSLRPTVVITQALCSVCAIDYNLVMSISR